MIKIIDIQGNAPDRKIYVFFADAKADVTSQAIAEIGLNGPIDVGSIAYTANGEVAFLKSNGEWNWI